MFLMKQQSIEHSVLKQVFVNDGKHYESPNSVCTIIYDGKHYGLTNSVCTIISTSLI